MRCVGRGAGAISRRLRAPGLHAPAGTGAHIRPMATTHSSTEDVCTAQVGRLNALAGSTRMSSASAGLAASNTATAAAAAGAAAGGQNEASERASEACGLGLVSASRAAALALLRLWRAAASGSERRLSAAWQPRPGVDGARRSQLLHAGPAGGATGIERETVICAMTLSA